MSKATGARFAEVDAFELLRRIGAPPGLERPGNLDRRPERRISLDRELQRALATPRPLLNCFGTQRHVPAPAVLENDLLWSICQELQLRSGSCQQDQRAPLKRKGHLGAQPTPVAASSATNVDMPLKPPGILMPITSSMSQTCSNPAAANSSSSLASTVASCSCGSEDEKAEALDFLRSPGTSPEASEVPELIAEETPRVLWVERLADDGHLRIHWLIDSKKFYDKCQQIISPSFEILPGYSFKLMVKAKAMGEKKGQASFNKARGCCSVHLKLVEGVAVAPTVRFSISVGRGPARGPVQHDFCNSILAGLANDEAYFGFRSGIDESTSTCLVSMEVFSSSLQGQSQQPVD